MEPWNNDVATLATPEDVDWSQYDFVDLGCSTGDSITYCIQRFHARRGIGVDIDKSKVLKAQAVGVDAVLADASQLAVVSSLSNADQIRFVSMVHFLEHLPDFQTVEEIIRNAAAIASDFLFIRHPSFEEEAYLTMLGLRQYWWHWTGHKSHVHVSDYCSIFDRLGLRQYMIRYQEPIWDSTHRSILTSDMPIDQHNFDPGRHRDRPYMRFDRPLWREQEIFVALRAFPPEEWNAITRFPF